MGNYENGAFTRQTIVDACKKLFYEKGYHETSYADICQEAHVNRGTIYYHFATKEAMRLEAQWGYFIDCKHVAEKYCQDERYVSIVAMALYNIQMQRDAKLARFCRQSCVDYPVFTEKKDLTYFYYSAYEYMWSQFWDMEKISPMAFATVYGYIMSCVRLLCEHPNQYDGVELFLHCCQASLSIWGAPDSLAQEILANARNYIAALPEEAYAAGLVCKKA